MMMYELNLMLIAFFIYEKLKILFIIGQIF